LTGAAVVALAHPSLAGADSGTGSSGSTGCIGTFRSCLHLSSPRTGVGEKCDPHTRVLIQLRAIEGRKRRPFRSF
jgi:hypothetical protein